MPPMCLDELPERVLRLLRLQKTHGSCARGRDSGRRRMRAGIDDAGNPSVDVDNRMKTWDAFLAGPLASLDRNRAGNAAQGTCWAPAEGRWRAAQNLEFQAWRRAGPANPLRASAGDTAKIDRLRNFSRLTLRWAPKSQLAARSSIDPVTSD